MTGKVLFTVNIGGYDTLRPLIKSEGFRHVCFTDDPHLKAPGWDMFRVQSVDPVETSRLIKLCVHQFLPEAELFVYIDANQQVLRDLNLFLADYYRGGLLLVDHPNRNCVYQEAKRALELGRVELDAVSAQMNTYADAGMPEAWGLFANGFFVRDRSCDDFMEVWWQELQATTYRDQISLPFLLWKSEAPAAAISWEVKSRFVRLHPHEGASIDAGPPKIWYFVPGAGDKNLGRTLNEHCELVPSPNDWILIRDNDTAFLHPYINKQLEDIVSGKGAKYDLLSCYTNRLGLEHQLPYGLMTEKNLVKLQAIAAQHYAEQYDDVIPSHKPTAGLFMLFPKRTWLKHRFAEGLANGPEFIDYQFSNGLLKKGMRIGICTGIFLLHYYRLHQKNVRDISHLVKSD